MAFTSSPIKISEKRGISETYATTGCLIANSFIFSPKYIDSLTRSFGFELVQILLYIAGPHAQVVNNLLCHYIGEICSNHIC